LISLQIFSEDEFAFEEGVAFEEDEFASYNAEDDYLAYILLSRSLSLLC